MAEKLEIVIAAKDQASAILKGVATNLRGELKSIESATAHMATATQGGFAGMISGAKKYESQIRTVSVGLAAVGAAATAVAAIGIRAAMEQAEATDKLAAAIFASGKAIDSSKLIKLAEDRQKITRYSDEATESMQGFLVMMGFQEDQVLKLTPAVQDLARATGQDLNSAAKRLGTSILTGTNTMRRMGIILDDTTLKSGDLDAILRDLATHVGGMAEKLGKTGTDQMLIFQNQVGELEEAIGTALLPAIRAITPAAVAVATAMTALANNPIGQALVAVGVAAGLAVGGLGAIGLALPAVIRGWEMLTGAQLANAAAARAAAVANAGALAAAGGGAAAALPAAAAGAGAAGIARGAAAGFGAGAILRGAARFALPAAIAYEGGRYAWGMRGGPGDMTFGETITTALHARSIEAAAAQPGIPTRRRSRRVGQVADLPGAPPLSPTEQSYAAQGWTQDQSGAWSAPEGARVGSTRRPAKITASSPNIDISQQGNETIVRISQDPDPGALDDATTAYLDDIMYAGDDI